MTLERGYLVARKSSSCVSVWEERTSFVEMKKYIFQSYPVCHLQQIGLVSIHSLSFPPTEGCTSKLLHCFYHTPKRPLQMQNRWNLVAWTLESSLERPSVFRTGKNLKPSGETREIERESINQLFEWESNLCGLDARKPTFPPVCLLGWLILIGLIFIRWGCVWRLLRLHRHRVDDGGCWRVEAVVRVPCRNVLQKRTRQN